MSFRHHILGLLAALGLSLIALPAMAAGDVAGQVTRQLKAQGYDRVEVHRTLLGKVVVTATGNGHQREIVIDPRNGALLRDLVRDDDGGSETVGIAVVDTDDDQGSSGGSGNSGSGSGGSGGDDSDDDSDDADDDSDSETDSDDDSDSSDSDSDSDDDSGSDDDDD